MISPIVNKFSNSIRPLGFCLLASAAALIFSSCSSLSGPKDSDSFIFLEEGDILQVDFIYSANPALQMDAPSIADETVEDRFRHFEYAFESLMAGMRFPIEFRLLERGESPDPAHPVLSIHATKWEATSFGEMELLMRARLEKQAELNTLGFFKASDMAPAINSRESMDRSYRAVMVSCLSEMLVRLEEHFLTPAEKESLQF